MLTELIVSPVDPIDPVDPLLGKEGGTCPY